MIKKNDGGPAFPVPNDANANGQVGMSLLDWFAGQALSGLIASEALGKGDEIVISAMAYDIADAMLKERA